jgi:hypothetical protein
MRRQGFIIIPYVLLFAFVLVVPGSSINADDKKIVVIEKSNNPDDETDPRNNDNLGGKTGVEATDLDDAEAKILGELGPGDCIMELHFRGHGSEGNQSVGDGVNHDDDKRIDGQNPQWKDKLSGLKGKFCDGASIHLWGCNVGSCDQGAEKLHELAKEFGVTVKGAVNKVNAGEQEDYDGPVQEADPDEEDPPECIEADDERADAKGSGEG